MTPPAENAIYHLVFLRSGPVLLVRRPDPDWRALQDEFSDFMTSIGPMTITQAVGWFVEEDGPDVERDADIRKFALDVVRTTLEVMR